jgi:predicted dehydrogenase
MAKKTGKIRSCVIGVGHFGSYHAAKYASLANADLRFLVDTDLSRAKAAAERHGCRAVTDYRAILSEIDAASICVPTAEHYRVAKDCLAAGVHVLLEKPMTADLAQADDLIRLADRRRLVLQIGYLERFALAAAGLDKAIERPLFIECTRLAPFRARSLDVSVVFDLMIHDIDMVLAMTKAPLKAVDAVGAPVLSAFEDIANTRLRFKDGCIANITASRISLKNERKMRIFQANGYISVDFLARKITQIKRPRNTGDTFAAQEALYADTDILKVEIESFLEAIRTRSRPLITGAEGRRALEVAHRIERRLNAHRALLRAQGFSLPT